MKLLAKTAEERYQTASGLESDFRRCLAEWESREHIDPFPLGAHDAPNRLLVPEKLYGREPEIDALLAAFHRVVAYGTPELVLVSGYSGIGKSSVVNELHKALVPTRGLFAGGKFDQYKRDIPYTTLAQAFQTLVRQILAKSEMEVSHCATWTWDLTRIRAKGYTDNVVDLMAGKLNRLPDKTQEALGQLACLGNVAEIGTLTLVRGKSDEETHAALWEAVRAGLVFRLASAYIFLHDRVQEAAYALIPESMLAGRIRNGDAGLRVQPFGRVPHAGTGTF